MMSSTFSDAANSATKALRREGGEGGGGEVGGGGGGEGGGGGGGGGGVGGGGGGGGEEGRRGGEGRGRVSCSPQEDVPSLALLPLEDGEEAEGSIGGRRRIRRPGLCSCGHGRVQRRQRHRRMLRRVELLRIDRFS